MRFETMTVALFALALPILSAPVPAGSGSTEELDRRTPSIHLGGMAHAAEDAGHEALDAIRNYGHDAGDVANGVSNMATPPSNPQEETQRRDLEERDPKGPKLGGFVAAAKDTFHSAGKAVQKIDSDKVGKGFDMGNQAVDFGGNVASTIQQNSNPPKKREAALEERDPKVPKLGGFVAAAKDTFHSAGKAVQKIDSDKVGKGFDMGNQAVDFAGNAATTYQNAKANGQQVPCQGPGC